MRIIQKTINHFFSLNTYPLSFVIIQQQISADRLLGGKSVSRLSQICKGETFWNRKVENFFLSVWKKPFAMNGIPGVRGERRREAQRRGDFSPAARAGARCEYILCLPVLPSSVAKVSGSEQTPGGGGQKGEGGSGASRDPQGCQCPVVRVSGPCKLPPTARVSPSDAESHLLRQRLGRTLRRLLLVPRQ